MKLFLHYTCAFLLMAFLFSCGGSGSGGQSSFTVGGLASGLSGDLTLDLTLSDKDEQTEDSLLISTNDTFTFSTTVASGIDYEVAVDTHPAEQTCVVVNGLGTISGADVSDIHVYCYKLPLDVVRVSVSSDGTEGNHASSNSSVSADGRYIAFSSISSNLVLGDNNGLNDIFVHDRVTSETEMVSVASDGTQANGYSGDPSISGDGRYVAFHSNSWNLVPDDINERRDVFVHDRTTGETEMVSVTSDGTQANGYSGDPSISGDGRYVAFHSNSWNLSPEDNDARSDIYVHDRITGETDLVSVASDGTKGNGYSEYPSISEDGRYVVFQSISWNLVPEDRNGMMDIFLHDRVTGETELISVASDGTQARGMSEYPSVNGDGSCVAFHSNAMNLVTGDMAVNFDVFVRDLESGETEMVSVASNGTQASEYAKHPSISGDGRYVAFFSYSANLVPGDTNGMQDVLIHDRETGETKLGAMAIDGTQANNGSDYPSISADGSHVSYSSSSSNLVDGDTNGMLDIFVFEH